MAEMMRCPQGHEIESTLLECPICKTISFTLAPPSEAETPRFPGYEVVGKLGVGGMGEVFRARNLKLQRDEAIKRIRSQAFASSAERQAFLREAESVAKIKHPHIVPIFAVGESEGDPFYAMEFVEGGSLAQRVRQTPMGFAEAAALVEKLARAMNVAHQQRLVHLDLKPENVLLTESGEPKITDFGLARPIENEQSRTAHWVGGTPGYMAPEQFGNAGVLVGPAADVFGLGATLYRLVTGRCPFALPKSGERTVSEWRAALEEAYHAPPPPVSTLRVGIPADFDAIIMRCLKADPTSRYQSAAALADDLHRFLHGYPVEARPVGMVTRGRMWARRNVLATLLGVLLFVTALAGFAAVVWQWRETVHERDAKANLALSEKLEHDRAENEKTKAQLALAEEQSANYYRSIVLADKEFWADHVDTCQHVLDSCPPKLRGWEWNFLKRRCNRQVALLTGHESGINAVAYLRDGKRLLSAGNDKTARIWDVGSAKEVCRYEGHKAQVLCAVQHPLRPDVMITGGRDRKVRLWHADTGKDVRDPLDYGGDVQALAVHPKLPIVAYAGSGSAGSRRIELWNAETNETVRPGLDGHRGWIGRLAFSPDGRWMASSDASGLVFVWNTSTWKVQQQFNGLHTFTMTPSVGFSADGKWFAWSESETGIKLWPIGEPSEKALVIARDRDVTYALAFSPNARELVTGGNSTAIRFWRFEDIYEQLQTGRYVEAQMWLRFPSIRSHTLAVTALAFAPDGLSLASCSDDKTIRLWKLDPSVDQDVWRDEGDSACCLAISRDGRRLARLSAKISIPDPRNAGNDPRVTMFDIETRAISSVPLARFGRAAAFLDDVGDTLLVGQDDGTILRWRVGEKSAAKVESKLRSVSALSVSGDGSMWGAAEGGTGYLGFSGIEKPGRIFLWRGDATQPTVTLAGHEQGVSGLAISPDGSRAASVGHDKLLRIWDTATGKETYRSEPTEEAALDIAWSNDGRWLATVHMNHRVYRWDISGPTPRRLELPPVGQIPSRVCFTPDGKSLLVGTIHSKQSQIKVFQAETGQQTLDIPAVNPSTWGLAMHPDGRLFTSGTGGFIGLYDGRKE
jgi:WD40 repeat protein/tRNA A-37 threonylcarbamoyl transferase component Bud32